MPEVTLELPSLGKSEKFTKPEVRLGRDPSCDVVFSSDKFPMVGRQHAVLLSVGGAWSVEDLQSTNGTFVNQVRIQRQQLVPGDTLRLGSDGPEVRVQFVDESYPQTVRPAGLAAAGGAPVTQPSATRPSEVPPTRPAIIPAPAAIPATKSSPASYRAPAPVMDTPEAEVEHSDLTPGIPASEQQEEISEEEDPMNDAKLSLLRNLVIVMVGLVLVVAGIVISQTQDIRGDLRSLHDEAANALTQSKLNERMAGMGKAVNGMDGKIHDAEKEFSNTMDENNKNGKKELTKSIYDNKQHK